MANLSSKSVEQKVLALLMQAPTHMKAISLEVNELFTLDVHKDLAKLIKDFVKMNKACPSSDTLKHFVQTKLQSGNIDRMLQAILLAEELPTVNEAEANYYFSQLENYAVGRKIYELHENLTSRLNTNIDLDFMSIKQDFVKELLLLGNNDPNIVRGFAYEKKYVKERLQTYNDVAAGITLDVIPFGMKSLDDVVGGMKKGQVSLLYGKSGGGKTITAINIAYNAAQAGYNVMYVSAEMTHSEIATKFDSLLTKLSSHDIIYGKLSAQDKQKYQKALAEKYKKCSHNVEKNLYISDIAKGASIPMILSELEIYKSLHGVYPDLLVIDHAGIVLPTDPSSDMSIHYNRVLKECKENAKYYKMAILTMMHESRTSAIEQAQAEKKKTKDEVSEGAHNMAMSHSAQNHVEIVIHIKQSSADAIINNIWFVINKCRHGQAQNKKLPMKCLFDISYIGDTEIKT